MHCLVDLGEGKVRKDIIAVVVRQEPAKGGGQVELRYDLGDMFSLPLCDEILRM